MSGQEYAEFVFILIWGAALLAPLFSKSNCTDDGES